MTILQQPVLDVPLCCATRRSTCFPPRLRASAVKRLVLFSTQPA